MFGLTTASHQIQIHKHFTQHVRHSWELVLNRGSVMQEEMTVVWT